MEREIIVTSFISGIIAPDLRSSNIGNGVVINRILDISYEGIEGSADEEATTEVIKDQLAVIYNGKQMYIIDLTESEILMIEDVLDNVRLDYDTYITDKALYSTGTLS